MQASHDAGVLHRDIKPANLLLDADGVVKITDFGIAQAPDTQALTSTGMVVGTPAYLAPERVAGRPASAASDLYSLGVVMYECLTGARPFTGTVLEVALADHGDPERAAPAVEGYFANSWAVVCRAFAVPCTDFALSGGRR